MICQWYTMIYHDIISTLQISRVEGYEPTGGFGGLKTTYLFGTCRWSRVPSSNSSQSQRQWHHSNIMFGILMRKCNHVTTITTDLGGTLCLDKLFSGMSCNGVSYLMVYCILLSLPRVVDWDEFWCKMCLQWRLGRCRFPLALLHLALRMNARWYVALVPRIIASQICSNTQPLKVQGFKTTVWPIISQHAMDAVYAYGIKIPEYYCVKVLEG